MSKINDFRMLVVTLAAMLMVAGCKSGKNQDVPDDPDVELVEMSDEEKSQSEVRYVMFHLKDFSFAESENTTFKVNDRMEHTKYTKIFERNNYQDALGSIVSETDNTKGYGIRMKLGDDKRSLVPTDKYFSGIIWHIRPGKTYMEYIFDSEEPRQEFLQEAVADGFMKVNDSLYSKSNPKISCINLSKYKGYPSLMLICY